MMPIKKTKVDYQVPNLNTLFTKSVTDAFIPVVEETGWRVVINNVWMCKKAMPGTPKRVYASREAVRDRVEEEFSSDFRRAFRAKNKAAYDACYHYVEKPDYYRRDQLVKHYECKDSDTVAKLDRACNLEWRRWMNSLYESGAVKYVEIK